MQQQRGTFQSRRSEHLLQLHSTLSPPANPIHPLQKRRYAVTPVHAADARLRLIQRNPHGGHIERPRARSAEQLRFLRCLPEPRFRHPDHRDLPVGRVPQMHPQPRSPVLPQDDIPVDDDAVVRTRYLRQHPEDAGKFPQVELPWDVLRNLCRSPAPLPRQPPRSPMTESRALRRLRSRPAGNGHRPRQSNHTALAGSENVRINGSIRSRPSQPKGLNGSTYDLFCLASVSPFFGYQYSRYPPPAVAFAIISFT